MHGQNHIKFMTSGLLVVLECGVLELINECFGTSVVIHIFTGVLISP